MPHPPEPVAPPPPSTRRLEARVSAQFPNTGLPASKFAMLRIKRVFGRVLDRVPEDWRRARVGLAARGPEAKNAGAAAQNCVIDITQ